MATLGVIRPEARFVDGQRPAHQRLGVLQVVSISAAGSDRLATHLGAGRV
jgi:hypothetical protein